MNNNNGHIVALDVGARRIGVATAHTIARLATPLRTLEVDDSIFEHIKTLLEEQQAVALVVGLPRNLEGNETAQTTAVQGFVAELRQHIDTPVYWQDEAVTSVLSEAALQAKKGGYAKGEVDAQAAALILDDFLMTHKEPSV